MGQGNVFTGVCDSVHSGGRVSASVHAGMPPPQSRHPPEQTLPMEQTPPQSRHPPEQTPPGSRHPREQTPPEQTPPWEQTPPLGADTPGCTPPGTKYTLGLSTPPGKQTLAYGQRAAGTHPTGIHPSALTVCYEPIWRFFEVHYNVCLWEILIFLHFILEISKKSELLFSSHLPFISLLHFSMKITFKDFYFTKNNYYPSYFHVN